MTTRADPPADTPIWPPPAELVTETWTPEDLRAGDLIFASKEAGADIFERCNTIAAQPWRHVGALVGRDDGFHVVEIIHNEFGLRDLATFMNAYDSFGAVRLGLDPANIAAATELMESRIGDNHVYPLDDLILAGMLALTTRGIFARHPQQVRAALDNAGRRAKELQKVDGADAFTCSGFIQWAYDQVAPDHSIYHDRWRSATTWPPRLETLDELFADETTRDQYADMSLFELYELTQAVDRGALGPPSRDEVGEIVHVLWAALTGYVFGEPPERIVTDGRWVTPADLWKSPSVSMRATLLPTE